MAYQEILLHTLRDLSCCGELEYCEDLQLAIIKTELSEKEMARAFLEHFKSPDVQVVKTNSERTKNIYVVSYSYLLESETEILGEVRDELIEEMKKKEIPIAKFTYSEYQVDYEEIEEDDNELDSIAKANLSGESPYAHLKQILSGRIEQKTIEAQGNENEMETVREETALNDFYSENHTRLDDEITDELNTTMENLDPNQKKKWNLASNKYRLNNAQTMLNEQTKRRSKTLERLIDKLINKMEKLNVKTVDEVKWKTKSRRRTWKVAKPKEMENGTDAKANRRKMNGKWLKWLKKHIS